MNKIIYRNIFDPVLLTTSLHFLTLYFTISNIYYSTIIILSTSSSLIWHSNYEHNYFHYILDYFFAILLTTYEIFNGNDKIFIIYINIVVLVVNKLTDVLSLYKLLNYTTGHSLFHIISSIKCFYVSYKFQT